MFCSFESFVMFPLIKLVVKTQLGTMLVCICMHAAACVLSCSIMCSYDWIHSNNFYIKSFVILFYYSLLSCMVVAVNKALFFFVLSYCKFLKKDIPGYTCMCISQKIWCRVGPTLLTYTTHLFRFLLTKLWCLFAAL